MRKQAFSTYLKRLSLLTDRQREFLGQALEDQRDGDRARQLGRVGERPEVCPHCQAGREQLRPWGRSAGLARYRCCTCGRTCNSLTGTPLAHLRKREQWLPYGQALIDGISVRAAAGRCQIDKNTAFLWPDFDTAK